MFLVIFHPMSDNFEPNQLSRVVAPHCGAMGRAISNFPKTASTTLIKVDCLFLMLAIIHGSQNHYFPFLNFLNRINLFWG